MAALISVQVYLKAELVKKVKENNSQDFICNSSFGFIEPIKYTHKPETNMSIKDTKNNSLC